MLEVLLAIVSLGPAPEQHSCDIVEYNVTVRFTGIRPTSKMSQIVGWNLNSNGELVCQWFCKVETHALEDKIAWPVVRKLPSKRYELWVRGKRIVCSGIARRMSAYDPEREDYEQRGVERRLSW